MKKLLILPALALSACTTGYSDMDSTAAYNTTDRAASSALEYVKMAGASDQYEIQSSRLALEKSSNPQVQQFARTMIDHHTETTQAVLTAARNAGLNPPAPQLMPMQRDMITQLQRLNGASFDQTYLSQQNRAHDMALTLHSNYASSGDAAPLRQAAQTAVPIIQRHIELLRSIR